MSELERLQREMFGGRPEAVWRWAVEARRRGVLDDPSAWSALVTRAVECDAGLLAAMMVALDDWPRVAAWLARLWASQRSRLTSVLEALGIGLGEAELHGLTIALRRANGALVSCELTPAHVLEAVLRARLEPGRSGVALVHGGMTRFVFKTVLALAVVHRPTGSVVVGVGKVNGPDASPDRVWDRLAPWHDEPARDAERAAAWAAQPDAGTVRLRLVELPEG